MMIIALLIAPAQALAFGMTFGQPLEERMGSEDGAVYYSRQAPEPTIRCRYRWSKDRAGHLVKTKRCYKSD